MNTHLSMVPNEQIHHTYSVDPFRYRYPKIAGTLNEVNSNLGSYDTALNIGKVSADLRLDYPFAQLWNMYRETRTRGVSYDRNDDYRSLVSIVDLLLDRNHFGADRALVLLREGASNDITNHVLHYLQAGELNTQMLLFSMNMLDESIASKIALVLDDMIQKDYLPDETTPVPTGLLQIAAFEHFLKPEELTNVMGEPGRLVATVSFNHTGASFEVVHPQKIVSARVLNSITTVDLSKILPGTMSGSNHRSYFIPNSALSANLEEGQVMEFTVETNGIQKKHNMIWQFLGETPTTGMHTSGQSAAASIEEMLDFPH